MRDKNIEYNRIIDISSRLNLFLLTRKYSYLSIDKLAQKAFLLSLVKDIFLLHRFLFTLKCPIMFSIRNKNHIEFPDYFNFSGYSRYQIGSYISKIETKQMK